MSGNCPNSFQKKIFSKLYLFVSLFVCKLCHYHVASIPDFESRYILVFSLFFHMDISNFSFISISSLLLDYFSWVFSFFFFLFFLFFVGFLWFWRIARNTTQKVLILLLFYYVPFSTIKKKKENKVLHCSMVHCLCCTMLIKQSLEF